MLHDVRIASVVICRGRGYVLLAKLMILLMMLQQLLFQKLLLQLQYFPLLLQHFELQSHLCHAEVMFNLSQVDESGIGPETFAFEDFFAGQIVALLLFVCVVQRGILFLLVAGIFGTETVSSRCWSHSLIALIQ